MDIGTGKEVRTHEKPTIKRYPIEFLYLTMLSSFTKHGFFVLIKYDNDKSSFCLPW